MASMEEGNSSQTDDVSPNVDNVRNYSVSTETLRSVETSNGWFDKIKRIAQKVYKVSSSLVGLIVLLIVYSFLGAWIFMAIENRHELVFKQNVTAARSVIIGQLLVTSADHSAVSTMEMKQKLNTLLVGYEADIMAGYKAGVTSSSTVELWGFWSSLFFCGTVFTTIGYGHIAPVTDLGRGVCMLYAGLGIPLALLVLAEVGKRFTVALKFLWAYVRRYYYTGNWRKKIRKPFSKKCVVTADVEKDKIPSDTKSESNSDKIPDDTKSESDSKGSSHVVYGYEVDENFNLPIAVAIVILIFYILLGALMYSIWEDWNFLEAFYFVFISISTIGFGDVVPDHPKFFILSSIYLYVGLSLVSMCINVAIEFFTAAAEQAKEKMDEATKKIGEKVNVAKDKVQQVGQDLKSNLKDETDKIMQFKDDQIKKVNAAKDKVQQVGQDLKSNLKDETDKIMQFKDEKMKQWAKSRSRSNTPVRNDFDPDQPGEESSSRKSSSASILNIINGNLKKK